MNLKQFTRKLRKTWRGGLIPPEIIGDPFYAAIARIAADPLVRTILEIGASSGEGSTEALIEGARRNPSRPVIHCIEVSPPRCRALAKRHQHLGFLKCHNTSSISVERFPAEDRVREFYETVDSPLNKDPLSVVLSWLRSDVATVIQNGLSNDGIKTIKDQEGVDLFDMVLIDGSEFTGSAELADVYGAKFVLLDDICTFKNFENYNRLAEDPDYSLVEKSEHVRNGYAVFERVLIHDVGNRLPHPLTKNND